MTKGRQVLAGAAVLMALALFSLLGGFRRNPDSRSGQRDDGIVQPAQVPPDAPLWPWLRHASKPPPPPPPPPPPKPEDKPGEPQKKLDPAPEIGAGGSGDGMPVHPPALPWDAAEAPFDHALSLRPAPGGRPGSARLGAAAVSRLKELLARSGGGEGALGEGTVRYRQSGAYESRAKGAPRSAADERGAYLIVGAGPGEDYLLLLPDGKRSMRVLRYGAEGEYKLQP